MRVLIAPDSFGGTLTAPQVASAIAAGWRSSAPGDDLVSTPMSDGGPGFVDVLHQALSGRILACTVDNQYGDPTPATVLRVGDTAYVESAQACGTHLTDRRDPFHATTVGVGTLIGAAIDSGASTVVVGLGGSGTNDGGAGILAALGARSRPEPALRGGPAGLAELEDVDLEPFRRRVEGIEVVLATDVDNPLLGLRGATNVFGKQKGLADEDLIPVDSLLERLADRTDRSAANARGAGAAGGIGFALGLAGTARRVAGLELVADAVGLREQAAASDLVVTGEGSFDFQSRAGKVPVGVAAVAASVLRPCIVLAGQVRLGAREMRSVGIESAYSLVDTVGEAAAFAEPGPSLERLAGRIARTWSR